MAMRFDIVSLFPEGLSPYLSESILGRAAREGKVKFALHNLRDWAVDKHATVDDTPYGGGAGMVLQLEPIYRCLCDLVGEENLPCFRAGGGAANTKILLFSAKGEIFVQKKARQWAELERIVMICGRYEGVDERVREHLVDEEVSLGKFVLTGGEIPALAVTDAVVRLLPEVLGNYASLNEESFTRENFVEYPHYTKPEVFFPREGVEWKVPPVLLSGHHGEIAKWREAKSGGGDLK